MDCFPLRLRLRRGKSLPLGYASLAMTSLSVVIASVAKQSIPLYLAVTMLIYSRLTLKRDRCHTGERRYPCDLPMDPGLRRGDMIGGCLIHKSKHDIYRICYAG
jgi:hypothetical protein